MSAILVTPWLRAILLLAALGMSPLVSAQVPSQLVTTGRGEVRVKPDRATVELAIETRSADQAEARRLNARKEGAVLAKLRAAGVPTADVTTVTYVVPDMEGSMRERETLARSVIRIVLRRPDQAGSVVDSALAGGATRVSSIDFGSSREGEARRTALASAIAEARADAEAMARAAGGTLGSLVELTSEPGEKDREPGDAAEGLAEAQRHFMQTMLASAMQSFGSATTATDVLVTARVRARWLLNMR